MNVSIKKMGQSVKRGLKKIKQSKKRQPFEKRQHDLTGFASIDFYQKDDFNTFASKLSKYNPNRFDPVAVRVYVQKGEPLITLFALDTFRQEKSDFQMDKLPVKKFRLSLSWSDFFKYVKSFDFTVTNGAFDIKDILVINK